MRVKEIKKIPKKDIVIPDYIMRPLENEENEDIKGLSSSFESSGMINEIDVRLKDGRYELMAGARRFVATKEDKIWTKVFEDVSDLKAMILGLTENLQRKGPDPNVRDTYIYKVWKKGKESGEFTCQKDLSGEIGINEKVLSVIIMAGDTKEKTKSSIIQKATSWDLERTKSLSEYPDMREDLLKREQVNQLAPKDMENISKKIMCEMDGGTKKDVIVEVLGLIDNTVNRDLQSNLNTVSSDTSPRKIVSKISEEHFNDVLITYKSSPEDVKEKWKKGEIGLKDVKDVKDFKTPEARKQVLKEIKVIENKKEVAQIIFNKDREMNIKIRKKQEDDMKKIGCTQLRTEFDVEFEKKLDMESNKDSIHDEDIVNRYQRLSSYTLGAFTHFHPRKLRTIEGKKAVLEIIRNLYGLYHDVLVDVGEIKEIKTESGSDKNIKRLEVENIKIVKRV